MAKTKQDKTPGQETRDNKKRRFLKVFRNNGGKLFLACELMGLHHNTVWEWRQKDKEFAGRYEAALEASTDEMEREMERRAKKKSDLLIMFSLKGRRPDKYRDNAKLDVAGSVTVNLVSYADGKGGEKEQDRA